MSALAPAMIYMTAGQVPETIMTGNTNDISHIAEFGWCNWLTGLCFMTATPLILTTNWYWAAI
jgi:hypothetical protein